MTTTEKKPAPRRPSRRSHQRQVTPAARRPSAPADDQQADSGFASTVSRAGSLWPETSQMPGGDSMVSGLSRFDPLAEERARLQQQAAAAFDVCHPAMGLRAVLLVQLALMLPALAGAASLQHWATRQALLCLGGLAATVVWLVLVCALRRPLAALGSAARASAVMAAGALLAGLAWVPLAWAGLAAGDAFAGAAVLGGGAALAGLLWAWLDLRSRIWHPAQTSARLAELQSRIRPHFLFNTLNTALALVRSEPRRAETVLEDLSELFRVALAETGAAVTLQEELELARRYLAIEEVRFGSRLLVRWQVDPRVHAALVPPLVLQPLVENAVRHGIEPAANGGRVSLSAQIQRGQVVVLVSNSMGEELGSPGHGMALHNLRERLRLLHDVGAQCEVWREPPEPGDEGQGQFHARITLPAP